MRGSVGLTVTVARQCVDVDCSAGGDEAQTACHGGRCVSSECSSENMAACGEPDCRLDADCTPADAICGAARCLDGLCLELPDDSRCPAAERCVPGGGCRPRPDAGDAGFDGGADAGLDAGLDASLDTGTDAGLDASADAAPPCPVFTFGEPALISSLSTARNEASPHLNPDGLRMYFVRDVLADLDFDVYVAERPSIGEPFGAGVLDNVISTGWWETGPHLGNDELEIFYSSGTTPTLDILMATRPSVGDSFRGITPVAVNSDEHDDWDPALSPDGLTLYFASSRPGGTGSDDIWFATRPSVGAPFGAAAPLDDVNSASSDRAPVLTGDGLHIFFGSERPGGLGGIDIWVASRTTPTGRFGPAQNVASLNTPGWDEDPAISADGRSFAWASERDGPLNLYLAPLSPCPE